MRRRLVYDPLLYAARRRGEAPAYLRREVDRVRESVAQHGSAAQHIDVGWIGPPDRTPTLWQRLTARLRSVPA